MAKAREIGFSSANAARHPKTNRLILPRLLTDAAKDQRLDEVQLQAAHKVLLHWADLETRGRLEKLNETQLQGDFLAQVFGQALGYLGPADGAREWYRIQHQAFGTETPDAVLGRFRDGSDSQPLAVVELKGPLVNLDRDRSGGRTAVDQCWDYLVNQRQECRWGILSNIVSFRLYERNSTKRSYEHFSLQSLRDFNLFKEFYVLLHRTELIKPVITSAPGAVLLLAESNDRQRKVGEELYDSYSSNRISLICHLHFQLGHALDRSVEMAQRLFDRIIFIAFCEDRHLLPQETIRQAISVSGFSAVTNPKWQNFKNLFRFVNTGNERYGIPPYNGGLFAQHDVDDLELPDEPWTTFFQQIGRYDFADEVSLDVLGRLFERSITELERLKEIGLFGGSQKKARAFAEMPQSSKRKQLGIYYTPPELTGKIVQYTVDELIAERLMALAIEAGIPVQRAGKGEVPGDAVFWRAALEMMRRLRIVDPACGSGAFLFQAYDTLEQRYLEVIDHLVQLKAGDAEQLAAEIPTYILQDNLFGVDLSPEAVEIAQLALWIRSAMPGRTLATLSANIVHGNSLVADPAVDSRACDWKTRFPQVFDRPEGGFDCVIGNPPWERIKVQEREYFSLSAAEIATCSNAAKRRVLVARLESEDPGLYVKYQEAAAEAAALLTYCRASQKYPLTGKGDVNLYAVFAELALEIVAPHGRVGLLVPSGIATDMTTKDLFAILAENNRLIRLYDFENHRKRFFAEVHASFKFCILGFGGTDTSWKSADFRFFLHDIEQIEDPQRQVSLSGKDIKLLNPNTRTCPIFRTRRDAEITKQIYKRVPILIDRGRTGPTANPWSMTFVRMFDQTNDAELFREPAGLQADGFRLDGNRWVRRAKFLQPVYEAKMIQAYDHRAADITTDLANWVRQAQPAKRTLVGHQNPESLAIPRYWVESDLVDHLAWGCIGFKDITSPTNQRTMIASAVPAAGFTNHFVLLKSSRPVGEQLCLLANLNSVVYDFVLRQKIGGITLNFFIVEQVPTLTPDAYERPCPWERSTSLLDWISQRVLKLSCTSEDMLPLADACDFRAGSFQAEYDGRLNKWNPSERAEMMAELDAAYFHLYGCEREHVEYIVATFTGLQDHGRDPHLGVSAAERVIQRFAEMSFAG